ncbi:polynucleotide adenylyltransferase PcnB [Amphritea japonica]|uniref:Poly(A) polymerase I n=1 Tax=Amphritea japonica ATCC BAA-1530 TaxID=1278309 RepID=A0A7R6P868_9GAMM|nr:polynucleotide adenylyltransferase PcnB [Amphritea japonica]BBB27684.1 poly(A) polymerase [Amphritea japonica ATCC BAA-1530]
MDNNSSPIGSFIRRLFGSNNKSSESADNQQAQGRQIIPEEVHQIPRRRLNDAAMKTAYHLQDEGFEGYLVGGCIRDLLMNKHPKDFDVATSATPDQAHALFRRSRLIGRRFKLLHVRFGRDLIEVATFRASHDSHPKNNDGEHGRQNDSGMIVRDNVYGTIEEDALRRDFTVNALYYCPNDHCIYDFTNGFSDLKNGTLRMIGDPDARYREDPVRMLRAARFAAKLGFTLEPASEAPLKELGYLLKDIAPARLFDEALKIFQSGHGVESFHQLRKYNLLEPLLQQTAYSLDNPDDYPVEKLVLNALQNTDRRIQQDKSVTPAFLFAALLWYPMQRRMKQLKEEAGMHTVPAMHEAANQVIGNQIRQTAIPRRFSTPIREIWELQFRLPRRQGKRADRLIEHPRFRAAYDLLILRENSGEELDGLGKWWTDYQVQNPQIRSHMSREATKDAPPKRRRRRRGPAKKQESNNG